MSEQAQFGIYGLIISALLAPFAVKAAWFRWLLAGGLGLWAAWVAISYMYIRFGAAGLWAGALSVCGLAGFGLTMAIRKREPVATDGEWTRKGNYYYNRFGEKIGRAK